MARRGRRELARELERAQQEARSARTLLLAAGGVVGFNVLLLTVNLWRGWRVADFLYVLTLALWIALLGVQTRIHARRKRRVEDLERRLAQSSGRAN